MLKSEYRPHYHILRSRVGSALQSRFCASPWSNLAKNKEERYSRVPRLSDTRYSKGNGDMQAAKRD